MTTSVDHHERLRQEHARSHAHLKRHLDANPRLLDDPDTYLHAFGRVTEEQLADLRAAGVPLSANPTASEIHDAHLHMRAHAPHRVRSSKDLIDHVHRELEDRRRQPRKDDGTFRSR